MRLSRPQGAQTWITQFNLCRIEKNLLNGAKNAKILLIFVNLLHLQW